MLLPFSVNKTPYFNLCAHTHFENMVFFSLRTRISYCALLLQFLDRAANISLCMSFLIWCNFLPARLPGIERSMIKTYWTKLECFDFVSEENHFLLSRRREKYSISSFMMRAPQPFFDEQLYEPGSLYVLTDQVCRYNRA